MIKLSEFSQNYHHSGVKLLAKKIRRGIRGLGTAWDGMARQVSKGLPIPHIIEPFEVLMPSGCACLYRKSALDEIGLFDEDFFAYCEDVDMGMRMISAGYQCFIAPGAYVTHYYSKTLGKFSLKKVYLVERNHIFVVLKNYPFALLLFFPLFTIWRYLVQIFAIVFEIGELKYFTEDSGKVEVGITIIKSWWDATKKCRVMFQKRREIVKKKKISNWALILCLQKYHVNTLDIVTGISKNPIH